MPPSRLACPHCGVIFLLPPPAARGKASCPTCRHPVALAPPPGEDSESVLDGLGGGAAGPLSRKGMRPRPRISLTWGDFRVLKKLGAGNMGAVYLAYQKSANRQVALKILFKHLALQPRFVDRFFREAKTMARLDHPGIVRAFGVGLEKGCPYFAMEYVYGFNAAAVLRELGRPFPVGDALHVARACALALGHAHGRGVVHRDVKPENILLTDLGRVKLTDLGLAKPMDEDPALSDSGARLGTPYYMAPEQAHDAKRADQRADVYALGGVLYHLLTGRRPFEGVTMTDLMRAKERGGYAPAQRLNPEVPARLDLILDRMLARDLRYRYASCADLLRDLDGLGLAHAHLGFNVLAVCHALEPAPGGPAAGGRLEVLLIDDLREGVRLTQEALDRSGALSNLSVVASGPEALAFLRREGKHAAAPRPDLIILGLDADRTADLEVLAELKARTWVQTVPLVVLAPSPDAAAVLGAFGLEARLHLARPNHVQDLESLVKSVYDLRLTVEDPARAP